MKVQYRTEEEIAIIILNHPPVNGLGSEVRHLINEYHQKALSDDKIRAIIISSAGKVFCGGADISEFGSDKMTADPALPVLCNRLEESSKLIVAAVSGLALGGGCELALACDYRIALPDAAMGLPEVQLGILPGAGGTQRLPRMIGVADALDMILSGKARNAYALEKLGAIDRISDKGSEAFLVGAMGYTRELLAINAPLRSCANVRIDPKSVDAEFFQNVRAGIAKQSRGFYAPERCIRAVEAACTQPLEKGLEIERALFMECMNTPQARAQQHIFFAQRTAQKVPDIAPHTAARTIKKVAIIGSGTMGGGIAMNFANAGIATVILDLKSELLERGMETIRNNYQRSVQKGRLKPEQAQQCLDCLSTTVDYAELRDVDLVIEAAFETMEVKQQVFQNLDKHCKPSAILASNTSTLDIDKIAAATKRPESVLGMHFFSPANIMRLLEIVRTTKTADDVLASALAISKSIKKTAVVARNSWGFIGNRMLEPYGREAGRLILEGASPAQVDKVMQEFGFPMGVPSMIDLAGLDIAYLIRKARGDFFYKNDPSYAAVADKLYELGRLGQKSGRGFYIYSGREREDDSELLEIAEQLATKHGVRRRKIDDREILERSVYTLINEGAKVLEEGIATRASDIDVVYCFGYGFPVYRGGPMRYANEIGTDKVLQGILRYRDTLGEYGAQWFEPAAMLAKLGTKGSDF